MAEELAQRLGARAMPIEAKRKLAAAGNALDEALTSAEEYLGTFGCGVGEVGGGVGFEYLASIRQNRLRRLAATFELQKEGSSKKHAEAVALHLFPEGHPQERGGWLGCGSWRGSRLRVGARLG